MVYNGDQAAAASNQFSCKCREAANIEWLVQLARSDRGHLIFL